MGFIAASSCFFGGRALDAHKRYKKICCFDKFQQLKMNNEIVVDGNDSQYLYAVPHDSSLCLIATSALIPTNASAIYVVQPYGHLPRLHNDGQFQHFFYPIDIQVWSFWPWFASEIALLADGLPRFLKQNRSVRQAELFIFLFEPSWRPVELPKDVNLLLNYGLFWSSWL